ncbi:MAG: hypothetical protein CMB80_29165 [Flammeovirgaceae bacterium]|nr:hypothetical protein [Flammeovirgaceae bacterium]MBE63330.1 hypothetical protein [Flammeovirgaceae bacterium]MBR09272.1 hypothetical protein [Rickettsiales bacterium]|tara:strand:- start:607 stop:1185 length:579 start_codon:yes stop_codon:yes gene_type:complete
MPTDIPPQSSPEPTPNQVPPITSIPKIKVPGPSSTESKETPSLFRRDKSATPAEEDKKDVPSKPLLEERSTAFSEEQVVSVWEQFKSERISAGASDTEKLVLDRNVIKSGEVSIKITLESQLENSILDKFEVDLIRYFRKKLDNTFVQLEREVSEHVTAKNLYTSKEKFEYMANLNPALREMKDRLGLDFEY